MSDSTPLSRRSFLGDTVAAVAAGSAALGAAAEPSGASQPTAAPPSSPTPHPSGMPYGMIGKAKFSRLILGGNLVAGWMHSRDLKYVPQLARAYETDEKILDTLKICEDNGVNTILESGSAFVKRYKEERGGHFQVIPSVNPPVGSSEKHIKTLIQEVVDIGPPAFYVEGMSGERLLRAGEFSLLAKTVEWAKEHGLPVGVGGHSLQVPMACEKPSVPCDFYVKTLHSDDYPSATPKELRKEFIWLDGGKGWYDNMWCINPEETIEFMKTVTKPWIAFKVLAAGAIPPQQAFAYAFHNGADFIAVGMFDFQVKENCTLVQRLLKRKEDRSRPWLRLDGEDCMTSPLTWLLVFCWASAPAGQTAASSSGPAAHGDERVRGPSRGGRTRWFDYRTSYGRFDAAALKRFGEAGVEHRQLPPVQRAQRRRRAVQSLSADLDRPAAVRLPEPRPAHRRPAGRQPPSEIHLQHRLEYSGMVAALAGPVETPRRQLYETRQDRRQRGVACGDEGVSAILLALHRGQSIATGSSATC